MRNRILRMLVATGMACFVAASCVFAGCSMHFANPSYIVETERSAPGSSQETTASNSVTEAPVESMEETTELPANAEDFLDSLKKLYAQDGLRDKVSASGTKTTCRLIVTNVDAQSADLEQYGANSVLMDEYGNAILQFDNQNECNQALDQLNENFGSDHVEKDEYMCMIPEDGTLMNTTQNTNRVNTQGTRGPAGSLSYGPDMIGSPTFISKMSTAQKNKLITVAVIDTGVDTDHEFLQGHLVSGASVIASSYEDGHGHGTHVSGIIVDSTAGCNVKIMPVQVLGADGSGTNSGVATGINWAVSHGANVLNLSLGGYDYGTSHYIDQAIANALNQGVTVVVAAGNDSTQTTYFCPAHIEAAITISAVDSRYNLAYFSNYGSAVDLGAPGVDVYSCVVGGYESWSGTSMAAPFATAAAALLLEADVASSPSAVNAVLQKYSVDCGAYGWDQYYGAGVINLEQISPQSIETPTEAPTTRPTEAPTTRPTEAPTTRPTEAPTTRPTEAPTARPTEAPTTRPTEVPTTAPTQPPTPAPTQVPTQGPTVPSGYTGTSISTSSNGRGTLLLTTDADVSILIILVDGVDAHSMLEYLGNNQYRIQMPSGGHTYSISSPTGNINSSGTF